MYRPIFIDTPENRVYMDVAEEMLKGAEPVSGTVDFYGIGDISQEGT